MPWVVYGTIHAPYYVRILNDDDYPANGGRLGLTDGRAVDPNCTGVEDYRLFQSGATGKPRKKIPAVIEQAGVFYVSETFRQLVEEMEPGRHQFFPYALRNGKTGPPGEEPYYIFNVTNRANSILLSDQKREEVFRPPSKHLPEGAVNRFSMKFCDDDIYTLHRQEIAGFHLWREAVSYDLFVSDEFLARFDAMKLKKLERVHCLEE